MRTLFATAFAAAALVGAPAFAADLAPAAAGSGLTFALDADVSVICGVYSTTGTTIAVPFGDLAARRQNDRATFDAQVVYRCNTVGGFSRMVSSANGGNLVRQGDGATTANRIAYRFGEISADRTLVTRDGPLGSSVKSDHAGSQAFLTGVRSTMNFNVPGVMNDFGNVAGEAPGTTVFAGDYADTVTVSITAK